ncbi:hypothetical protein IM697_34645 [Streptomyces ferrugineus]|uniref:Uncharacterized protein n=1 Tax=Streptomyces ferrugineus TaxID=1413221 RepID=A0A7M2SFU0_9ACTN|nr:hypothetical protein [Streptomyces ferrugineus]QOV35172.1 hypothetical protein IM697_34645 [Streptomyces ferrugineus]
MTTRLSDAGAVLKWGGVVGVAVCLLLRYVEPAPRWDVLACIGVALLGVLVSWAGRLRERVAEVPRVAALSSPTGFRLVGGQLPERKERQRLGVLLVLLSVALLLFGSASHVTPQLADARAGSARISAVTVDKVLSQSARPVKGGGMTYTSKLAVTVNGDGGDGSSQQRASLRGTIKTSGSVGPRDRLWALYNPDRTGKDAQFAETREELAALQDGSARPSWTTLGLSSAAAAGGLALLLRRRFKPLDDSASAVTEALRTGNAQALAVTVAGTAPGGSRAVGVGLRLTAEDGERQLHIGRSVDVEQLADTLWDRTAWLYWERAGDNPPPGRPGRRGEMLPAVLVVGSGDEVRHVSGWMPRTPEWPVAQGRRLSSMNLESAPEVRQFGTGVLRPPRTRVSAVVWLGLAVLATVAAAALPVGGGGQELVQMAMVVTVLCTIIGNRLADARWRPSVRRQERRVAGAAASSSSG